MLAAVLICVNFKCRQNSLTLFVLKAENTDEDVSSSASQKDKEDANGTNDEQQVKEACDELKEYFQNKLVDSLQRATRYSLDCMRKRLFYRYVENLHM